MKKYLKAVQRPGFNHNRPWSEASVTKVEKCERKPCWAYAGFPWVVDSYHRLEPGMEWTDHEHYLTWDQALRRAVQEGYGLTRDRLSRPVRVHRGVD